MRISDWISDVCSSDLQTDVAEASPESAPPPPAFAAATEPAPRVAPAAADAPLPFRRPRRNPAKRWTAIAASAAEIGRAACRERVCQYGSLSVVAGSVKKTIQCIKT